MRRCVLATILLLCSPLTLSAPAPWTFVTEAFPPFSSQQDETALGQPPSSDASPFAHIIYQTCQALHRLCSIKVYPWRRALSLAETGEVQGVYTVVHNRQREQAFFLTPMLIRGHYSLFTRQDTIFDYRQPADLSGRTIAVYGPSGTSDLVEKLLSHAPRTVMRLESDNVRVLKKLAAGRYGADSAAVVNADVAHYLLGTEKIESITEVAELAPIDYAIGLSRASVSSAEAEAFNHIITQQLISGQLAKIIELAGLTPTPQVTNTNMAK
jgi:polar amino acid transport system substrate-binding protein